MRKTLNALSILLMVAGLTILLYVGVSYAGNRPSVPSWNATLRQSGQALAKKLASRQTVRLPSRLGSSHLGTATGAVQTGTRLVIPKIGVDAPIVESAPLNGVWPVVDWSVGHLSTSPNPGQPGNMALAAHDDIKGEIFKRVAELKPGDPMLVYTSSYVYRYVVTGQQTVDPSNVSVLAPTKAPTVTLVSCAPYWVDTQRLIVQGVLKSRSSLHR